MKPKTKKQAFRLNCRRVCGIIVRIEILAKEIHMKKLTRLISALLLVFLLGSGLVGCDLSTLLPDTSEGAGGSTENEITSISIIGEERREIYVGDVIQLTTDLPDSEKANVTWESTNEEYVTVSGGTAEGIAEGTSIIYARYGKFSAKVLIHVSVPEEKVDGDPYSGVSKTAFYRNYTRATSYLDAYWRTQHGFMSGSIEAQDQKPTLSSYQPKSGKLYIKNSVGIFGDEGNSYTVVDAFGTEVLTVYRSGAYVSLEEVAAYLTAFGTIPPNYIAGKNQSPTSSIFGEYLRLNHSDFSGSTKKYPYEPVLPDISGCGGKTKYKEIDIGTTGTDCDPTYIVKEYNDGKTITRGAARIVYTYSDLNGNQIIDINEKHVFYTYNHYNDFQEYLNYYGGWGEMFGNITGGGTLSSKNDCNPTDYVEVKLADVSRLSATVIFDPYLALSDRKRYA